MHKYVALRLHRYWEENCPLIKGKSHKVIGKEANCSQTDVSKVGKRKLGEGKRLMEKGAQANQLIQVFKRLRIKTHLCTAAKGPHSQSQVGFLKFSQTFIFNMVPCL